VHDLTRTRVSYRDEHERLEGYLVRPAAGPARPGVLVVPSWLNVAPATCRRADRLAEEGYGVFVADLFGAGVRPGPPQDPMEIVTPLLADRLRFRRRLLAGLNAFAESHACYRDRIAAIGYCLGGCGVLELARAGAPLQGVVSLHGMLTAPLPAQPNEVTAAVLVLHGDSDPLAPFDDVDAFCKEMRAAGVSWEVDVYGGARHAFTGEGLADAETAEAARDELATRRSWQATLRFLDEVLMRRPRGLTSGVHVYGSVSR
jgi:dienelactone hydrolase